MEVPALRDDVDVALWFDPMCPFCWMTSRWLRRVQDLRGLAVEYRLISLRILNADVDYDAHFPPEYEAGHDAGLRLLRVAASVRAAEGAQALAPLHVAFGARVFEVDPPPEGEHVGMGGRRLAEAALADAGLDTAHADALVDDTWDEVVAADTALALAAAGEDVGTPILQFSPPDGPGFFGPVISRLPSDDDAVRLWDHVVGLAEFAGFAELKRSLRELPQLRALGVGEDEVGEVEDWHGGSRRQKHERG